MRIRYPATLVFLLLSAAPAVADEQVVREFRGIGQTETEPFYVNAPWLIEWWSRPQARIDHKPSHLEVYLYNASTNEFLGRIARHAGVGRGEVLLDHSGRFRLRVQGQATNWELRVIKIDEEFAERLRETRPKPTKSPGWLRW